MTTQTVREKSYLFAVRIVRLCLWLRTKKHYEIASQLLRSGTSIGANIEEASASFSRKEFFQKMAYASKEARETHYWLRLLKDTDILTEKQTSHVLAETEELIKMLTTIVKKGNAADNNSKLKPKT